MIKIVILFLLSCTLSCKGYNTLFRQFLSRKFHSKFSVHLASDHNIVDNIIESNNPSQLISDNLKIENLIKDLVIPTTTDVISKKTESIANQINTSNITKVNNQVTSSESKSYIMCSNCKSSYLIDENNMINRNIRVRCSVCDKDWFQTVDRIMKTDRSSDLVDMTEAKINDVKRILADRNIPKHPRVDKVGIFVGNLPYNYEEKDVIDLFAEYGLLNVAIVRDPEGLSKGFGFIEVCSEEMADKAVKEMNHFFTDFNRKLTVRMQVPKAGDKRSSGQSNSGSSAATPPGERTWSKKT